MNLKKETFDAVLNELKRRVENVPKVMGVEQLGITAEDMGLDEALMVDIINNGYLKVFTVEEVEEMVKWQQKFASRTAELEKIVEEKVSKTIENSKDRILNKLKEAM